jgi:integrase
MALQRTDEDMTTESKPTRKAQLLTVKGIEAMEPDAIAYRVPDTRAKGLALRVAADGGKTWGVVAYRIKGKGVRRLSLGRYQDIDLEAVRERANDITSAARKGRDLIAKEEAARNEYDLSFTVERLISEYLKRRVTGRLRTAGEVEGRLRRALASMMKRKAADILRRDLRQLLDATADQGFTREAGHLQQAIGAMFKWAVAQDIVATNPAQGLAPYSRSPPRNRVLDENEITALWRWLDVGKNISTKTSSILKLQLCLGARSTEIAGMRTSEFETDGKGRLLWTLPVERSKNKRARVTPILGLALEIITPYLDHNNSDILFENEAGKPLYSGLIGQQLLQRLDRLPIDRFSTHDLRRTTATMMTAQLGLPLELVAMVVGHTAGGSQTQTLVRHYVHDDFVDRKAHALAAWDRRLRAILAGEEGKVVALRA